MNSQRAAVREVADRLVAVDSARRLRCDATSIVERLAARCRADGLARPVAAALARAARVAALAGTEDFADRVGVPVALQVEAEAGGVRFGELPAALDPVFAELGIDLLALADLAARWDHDPAA